MLKLNLGCGRRIEQGYVNVDAIQGLAADEVWDIGNLMNYKKYPDGSVDEIRAWHVLEHLPIMQARQVLREWRRILRPITLQQPQRSFSLDVRVPDLFMVMEVCVTRGGLDQSIMHHVYANHTSAFDVHHWGFDAQSICTEIKGSGFEVVDCDRNAASFEIRVLAVKPAPNKR